MGPFHVSTHPALAGASATVADLVRAAKADVPGAFDQLVLRFQDMAVATAYGWLRDPQQAEDAAQEAFVEVVRNLDRLEEPAAFPGFLRTVVRKHCDRRTRGRKLEVPVAEPGSTAAAPAPIADAALAAAEERAQVRAALEGLPAGERLVVALHYLAGLTQTEVATWLELPLSTVKKRLHSARGRLRDTMETLMQETFDAIRPSRSSLFSDTIRLFLAIREGDVDLVAELLERDSSLAEVEERWEDELTRAHALPVPNGGTPLVRAAQRNQVEMVDLLLDHGADINRACPCAGGESPLWAAVASGQVDASRRLLERGADPDRRSFADHTPLHVAALRGFDEIVDLLCDHGADGGQLDLHGRMPADWARQKGHDSIASKLARRFGPFADAARGASVRVARWGPESFAIGIKALDLFAPVLPGSLLSTRFDPGLGAAVLLAELTTRWARRAHRNGAPLVPAAIWVGWERQSTDLAEMEHLFAELDLAPYARLLWSPAADDEETRRETMERAILEARELKAGGLATPLVIALAHKGRRVEIEAALPKLAAESITTIVAERYGDPADDQGPVRAPFDGRIAFDASLVALGHFPAIHPLASTSNQLVPEVVGERHCRIVQQVRQILATHRRLVPDLGSGERDRMDDEERSLVARARRLQAFLTQPFLVAESFTGKMGTDLGLPGLLDDLEEILNGRLDETSLGRVPYKGRLSEILESAPS